MEMNRQSRTNTDFPFLTTIELKQLWDYVRLTSTGILRP